MRNCRKLGIEMGYDFEDLVSPTPPKGVCVCAQRGTCVWSQHIGGRGKRILSLRLVSLSHIVKSHLSKTKQNGQWAGSSGISIRV